MTITPSGQPGGNDGSALPDATDPITSPGVNDGNWHMVPYSYTGTPGQFNNGSLYVDGVLVANNTVTPNLAENNLDAWIGGYRDYANRFLPAYIPNPAVFSPVFYAARLQCD